jgi:hypothetical protein
MEQVRVKKNLTGRVRVQKKLNRSGPDPKHFYHSGPGPKKSWTRWALVKTYSIDILEIKSLPEDLIFESGEKSKEFLFIVKVPFNVIFFSREIETFSWISVCLFTH